MKSRLQFLFLFLFLFIGCNEDNENIFAPNIADKGNVELANGEATVIKFISSGSAITSCTISPRLPTGLSLDSDCTIRGTATVNQAPTSYVVTGRNASGRSDASIEI